MAGNGKAAICVLLMAGISGWTFAHGQTADEVPQPVSRIVLPINETKLVTLRGNTYPEARPEFDLGLVDQQLRMERMVLILQRSPEQQAALEKFMARQLDPRSPDFHHWLKPEEFGALYGPSDNDILSITAWLQNQGFSVDNVGKGRVFIEFSGSAALVQHAFHTEMHRYMVKGQEHVSNNSDPKIPEAISPVVAGIFSLNNFFTKPLHHDLGSFRRANKTGKWTPENEDVVTKPLFNVSTTGGTFELVSPFDFATIYNVLPLWNANIDGTGQTIAIAGRSDISLTDVATFRSAFGLPANAPTIITNGTDPGVPTADDKVENTLDVEWSGAVAKGATIKFVTTASTATTDGAVSSATYIIDNNVAPVMSFSYGACELAFGTAGNAANNMLWQQGAAEGITIFVASGDQGAAACDGGQAAPYGAEFGFAVSGTSSTPYNVAVGGTDLNWANSSKTYWSSTNAANGSSVLGYIPEVPWNGTCVSDAVDELIGGTAAGFDEEQTCQALLNQDIDIDLVNVIGGSGGVSACTTPSGNTPASCSGGYAKPSWQAGTGVPADGKRDVPDLSLFASSGALNSAYVICDSQSTPCTFSNANDALAQGVGGTSVASPAMAGIMALVNQKMGSAQGNANVAFYALAARDNRSSCNANTVGSGNACNFYDITTDNNAVPCIPGDPNCTLHHTGDEVGVLNGYTSTVGYDLTTGLGSVNANNLVNNWHLVVTAAPTVTTGAASMVTSAGASVAGTVNPNGADTKTWFQYGTSSTLSGASSTAMQDIGSGTSNVAFNQSLSGLASNTKYFFRAVASNSDGTVNGAINSFTTTALIPTVTTGASSSVTSGGASVAGTVNPNGADTKAWFQYGTSSTLSGASSTAMQDLGSGTSSVAFSASLSGLASNTKYFFRAVASNSGGTVNGTINSFTTLTGSVTGLQFIPVTPCRVADTRNATGPFGGPELGAGSTRSFAIPQSACGIPTTALAYSLNVTVVPSGALGFLTMWPTGLAQPAVSTLNSDGRIKANAAITPAGTNGGVSIFASNATQVILDIDGYFVPAGTASALAFYPLTPCRVADTRNATGPLGGPSLAAGTSRAFPVRSSSCNIPATAQAYSLNVTAVPHGALGFLTTWPTGIAQPVVSTLNSPTGAVTANAALVPAGTTGEISVFVSNASDVVLDVNGYFAPLATGGLSLYTVTPCRVIDTRSGAGAFNGVLAEDVETSTCAPPAAAQAYVLNATVVPPGKLNFLTLWPAGETQPVVSTLNAADGAITSNMAIVPTTNGSIDAFSSNPTNLILDISSYFAP
jgi:hypothetical protein